VKDTVAEMAAKAHEISLEAGSKMAAAMKDVVNAAAGLTGFVLESARDLVQYMVRRGQMTQEEADKLIKQAEEAQGGRPAVAPKASAAATPAPKAAAPVVAKAAVVPPVAQVPKVEPVVEEDDEDESESVPDDEEMPVAAEKAEKKPEAKKAEAKKPAAKAEGKPVAKKAAAKSPAEPKKALKQK
jgi:polyhydroxyalkanoate synthesis regulator phasin